MVMWDTIGVSIFRKMCYSYDEGCTKGGYMNKRTVLSTKEAAHVITQSGRPVTDRTVRNWLNQGLLTEAHRVGKLRYVTIDSVVQLTGLSGEEVEQLLEGNSLPLLQAA